MRSFHKFPRIFQRSPSKQLERFVQASAKQSNNPNDEFEQVLNSVLHKLWKSSEQSQDSLESDVKTVITRLEGGLTKADYDAPTVLRGLVTMHRLLIEGPDNIHQCSSLRTCLQLILQVSERALNSYSSSRGDDLTSSNDSKAQRIYLMATQYSSLLKEKIEVLKEHGSIISGDWCPSEEAGRQNLYIFDFLETRITPSDALKAVDSESPDVQRREMDYRIPSALTFLKKISTYGQSLSMLISRLTALLNGKLLPLDVKQHVFNVTFMEARFLIRLLVTMVASVILLQIVPQCDESRFQDFVSKYPEQCLEDRETLWRQLRKQSDECRFRLVRKLTHIVDSELCTCQYQMVGGESWLLRAIVLIMRSDIIPFYFSNPAQPLLPEQAYMSLLRLTTCSARHSFKNLPEIGDSADEMVSVFDTIVEAVKAALATESMGGGFRLTNSVATPGNWSPVGIALISSLETEIQGLETMNTSDENRMPRAGDEFDTGHSVMNNLFVSCDFSHVSDCGQLPVLGLDAASAQRKWWKRWRSCHRHVVTRAHRFVDPTLLPDRRLINTMLGELQFFLITVRNTQFALLHEQRRFVEIKKNQHGGGSTSPRKRNEGESFQPVPITGFQANSRAAAAPSGHSHRSRQRERSKSARQTEERRHRSPSRSPPITPVTPRSPPAFPIAPPAPIAVQQMPQHFRVLSDAPRPRSLTPRTQPVLHRQVTPPSSRGGFAVSPLAAMAGYPTAIVAHSPPQRISIVRNATENVSIPMGAPRSSPIIQTLHMQQARPSSFINPGTIVHPARPGTHMAPQGSRIRPSTNHRYTPRDNSMPPLVRPLPITRKSQPVTMNPGPKVEVLSTSTQLGTPRGSTALLAAYEIRSDEIGILDKVGNGATATVYKGTWQGTDVAVKMFKEKSIKESRSEVIQELLILFKVRHPNLVLIMGTVLDRSPSPAGTGSVLWPKAFVSEFCEGGTLFSLLHRKQGPKLNWVQRIKIARDVAQGCCYLHTFHPPIVHRDLKSLNILLAHPVLTTEDHPQAKISDFGMSAWKKVSTSSGNGLLHGIAGTYHWMAPEVVLGRTYRESVDVYSYGIILYELCSDALPYEELSYLEPQVIGRLVAVEGRRPDLSKLRLDCPRELRDLMVQCWNQDPCSRPNFQHVIKRLDSLRR
eukprot:Gregarina_sp_Poly_1__10848@NODE_83_length_15529_cov_95_045531_g71_i0_p1_GENE_NODE_83_length_15529_cov_95_045531_g71_i0NODE_83_length_15529_cov_95_045531_g71_i0_p1_ORF_typecomplete_len1156_score136_67Pkinase_Tyr/PF07714_17/1_2e68Pkinase/PF00069_25/8_9e52Pkinase_fungal/PF17667_1/8_7e07ANTH/PF07651_16/4_2e05Kinaselike/PF14531_6/1_8e03Kinaselike/PF14531_6/0_0021Transformer/PF06495_11/0_0085FTA2/PF13095_6/0_033Kdo/PF06293_14/6_1e03Kdo/PF06293_14/0_31_NODE_83_length_15529_cov_95_045531_g71_i019165383